jgi:hypothetical protein
MTGISMPLIGDKLSDMNVQTTHAGWFRHKKL